MSSSIALHSTKFTAANQSEFILPDHLYRCQSSHYHCSDDRQSARNRCVHELYLQFLRAGILYELYIYENKDLQFLSMKTKSLLINKKYVSTSYTYARKKKIKDQLLLAARGSFLLRDNSSVLFAFEMLHANFTCRSLFFSLSSNVLLLQIYYMKLLDLMLLQYN